MSDQHDKVIPGEVNRLVTGLTAAKDDLVTSVSSKKFYRDNITQHANRWHWLRSPLTALEYYKEHRSFANIPDAIRYALRDTKSIVIDHAIVVEAPEDQTSEYRAYKKVTW